MGFPRQGYWSGLPFPFPGDLPDPEIEPSSPALQADSLPSERPWKPIFIINNSIPTLPFLSCQLSKSPQVLLRQAAGRATSSAHADLQPTDRVSAFPHTRGSQTQLPPLWEIREPQPIYSILSRRGCGPQTLPLCLCQSPLVPGGRQWDHWVTG